MSILELLGTKTLPNTKCLTLTCSFFLVWAKSNHLQVKAKLGLEPQTPE